MDFLLHYFVDEKFHLQVNQSMEFQLLIVMAFLMNNHNINIIFKMTHLPFVLFVLDPIVFS